MTYHVTCSTDNNYLQHCTAMLCSLFENNRQLRFHVHLLHSELTKASMTFLTAFCKKYENEISYYKVDDSILANVCWREVSYTTIATYYRILLPSLLREDVERVLYLDCDVIVMGSVGYLFNLDLNNYGLAAVKDASPYDNLHREIMGIEQDGRAFCAGVLMINLDYWRKHNCQEALLAFANTKLEKCYLDDQDALNNVFRNRWFMLPYKWGRTPLSIGVADPCVKHFDVYEYAYEPQIIHYAGELKPWCDIWFPERKYYLHYLNLSKYPHSQKKPVNRAFAARTRLRILRYFVAKYIHPFVPNIIEVVVEDIVALLKLTIALLGSVRSARHLLITRWMQKYNL